MSKPDLNLPAMDSPIVREPDNFVRPFPAGRIPSHRIHARRLNDDTWQWAHLVHMVTGWKVVAAGELPAAAHDTALGAASWVAEQFLGENGDGVERLQDDAFMQFGSSTIAHQRRETDQSTAYCGKSGGNSRPAVFNTKVKGHAEQHCIDCGATYRAEHYGRIALTA